MQLKSNFKDVNNYFFYLSNKIERYFHYISISYKCIFSRSGFRRFLECGEKLTEQKCGREAVEMGRTISELAVTELPNVVCNSFDPASNQCQALLPPKGSNPKGTQSSSQLARLLATALGN